MQESDGRLPPVVSSYSVFWQMGKGDDKGLDNDSLSRDSAYHQLSFAAVYHVISTPTDKNKRLLSRDLDVAMGFVPILMAQKTQIKT